MITPEQKVNFFVHHVEQGKAAVVAREALEIAGPRAVASLQLALDTFRERDLNVVYAVARSLASKKQDAKPALGSLRAALMHFEAERHGGAALLAQAMLEIDPALRGDGFITRCIRESISRAESDLIERWTSKDAVLNVDRFIEFERRARPYQFDDLPLMEELRELRDGIGVPTLGLLYAGPFAVLFRRIADDRHLITADPELYLNPQVAEVSMGKILGKLGPAAHLLRGEAQHLLGMPPRPAL